ncbi:2-amino-4-ketopentanoate thiolase [Anaerosalibacter bizertensis]|uniref:2-amino-4-ketopentanoate thiolase n=1 Tax=Anaerosalibacter bizertensis TaxID=932217 RepID=A0A9Q4ADQ0_9FIRM|nr:2-amino-4-oxopentanoate thiolase subunit OrtA [Anaerosalibacter bizertensis]MBV1817286.1 2-amino-4-ketopentanoate thiolase [Bacteroidales bacterium MSK.15.36]HHV25584.1 2-amino-4-ketopentanoate thiolase [Tissierellia bacterium]MBU5294725.1 2-amino-4-ketopentanoate thiolase [Anaerosalibacter bizertensis]MCB5560548.1 2-amino-4-ketopentanoate thiolase [Anaerosalibacter bizertensis]MCG4565595.1 2-amino-4-ketopentanoate thiolase [Anaerosalibacter bizertensis]
MNYDVKKGSWVQVHQIILKPEERTAKIPEETKKVPLELWVKGYLNVDGDIGDIVEITTLTKRKVEGELVEVNPIYDYGFGEEFVPELVQIGEMVKSIVRGDDK